MKWSCLLAQFERQLKRCKSICRHSIINTATPFSNRHCMCQCMCVCVILCATYKCHTQHASSAAARIDHNQRRVDGEWGRECVDYDDSISFYPFETSPNWLLLHPLATWPPLCQTPPTQLVAQVGQAQNLSPIIVDIVYGCQRPQLASQSHLICRRLLQWQSTPVTQLLSLSHCLPSNYSSHSTSVPGLSLLELHHGLSFHFLLITFSCNGASYLDLHFNWTVSQLFNFMRKLINHSEYYNL